MELSRRQAQVVECVARGMSDKRIAAKLNITVDTVRTHIQQAASHIPGPSNPRHRLTLWFFSISLDEAEESA